MSTLMSQARVRVPRFAESAVERARLTVVPPRSVAAPRAPFVTLVLAVLAAGVVGLLMFNTHMQQDSFRATAMQERAKALTDEQQSLDMELQGLRSPQHLAVAARRLGMVAPAQAAFLRVSDGRVLGQPLAASSGDAVRVVPFPAVKPAALNPAPRIVRVVVPVATAPGRSGNTAPASAGSAPATGMNDSSTSSQRPAKGAHR